MKKRIGFYLMIIIALSLSLSLTGAVCEEEGNDYSDLLLLMGNPFKGIVTTFAGPAQGSTDSGTADGTGNDARFMSPHGGVSDGKNLYIADSQGNKIRKIVISTRMVTTLAGPAPGSNSSGDDDGTGTAARFFFPFNIATDGTDLYVTDGGNNKIRKIVVATGVVTTFAGPDQGTTDSGDTDGTGNAARFNQPHGICTDGTNLYVADTYNNKIRKIVISTGAVTTISGPAPGSTTSGDTDGTGNDARFSQPYGITIDGNNLYVADTSNHKIRKIVISTGVVTTLAGPAQGSTTYGSDDGIGNDARFCEPYDITILSSYLYVSEIINMKIRKIALSTGEVTTLAGPAPGSPIFTTGDADGTGYDARFDEPAGIATDGTSLYVGDSHNNKIRRIK